MKKTSPMTISSSVLALLAATLGLLASPVWADAEKPAFPADYKSWTHINTMILPNGHFEGLHHIYANASALKALREGTPYPDGAIFVFDLFEVVEKDGVVSAGERKFVDVMQRDKHQFAATGGWGYEEFEAQTRKRLLEDAMACHSCHVSQEAKGFVFSTLRE